MHVHISFGLMIKMALRMEKGTLFSKTNDFLLDNICSSKSCIVCVLVLTLTMLCSFMVMFSEKPALYDY